MQIQGKIFVGFLLLLVFVDGVLYFKAGQAIRAAEQGQKYYQEKVLPKVERVSLAGFHFKYLAQTIQTAVEERSPERMREASAISDEIDRLARGESEDEDPLVTAVNAFEETGRELVRRLAAGEKVNLAVEMSRLNEKGSEAARVLAEVRSVVLEGEGRWRGRLLGSIESFQTVVLLVSALGVGLAFFLSLALGLWITAPVREIHAAMAKMAETSDLDQKVPVRTTDEIGALGEAFNVFLRTLRAQRLDTKLLEKHAELSREKFAFQSNLSHELKTPLTTMRGVVDFLQKDLEGKLTQSQIRFFNIMDQELERITRLVYNLVDFQRIESDSKSPLEASLTAVDARMAIGPALDKVKSALRAHPNVSFQRAIPKEELWVEIDWNQLVAVLSNLLDNSIKFTEGEGQIGVEMTRFDDEAKIVVWDEGIGIPIEAHDRIFDRFYQVDASMTRKYGGTGIGLFIVKNIVEANMGSLRVDSAPGKGTRIVVKFPLAKHPGRPAAPNA